MKATTLTPAQSVEDMLALGSMVLSLRSDYALCVICRQAKLHSEDMKAITLTPTQSVEAMLKVIAQVKPEDSGKYLDYNGEILPY